METVKVTIDAAGRKMMEEAAAYAGAPLSIWARMVLLDAARGAVHRKKCENPAASAQKILKEKKKSAAQELHDAVGARIMAARLEMPADVAAEIAGMDAEEDAAA